MRRWQRFGFAGQFSTDPLPQLQLRPSLGWVPYPPVYFSMPHKQIAYDNLNYSLGAAQGTDKHVFLTFWQEDPTNWIPPDPACPAQHLPDRAVAFYGIGSERYRLFDALFSGFPPYPPYSVFTDGLFAISFDRPASIES